MAYFWANRSVDFLNTTYSDVVDTTYFDLDGYGNPQGVLWTYANGMVAGLDGHGIDANGITGTIDIYMAWDSIYDTAEAYGVEGINLPVSTAIDAANSGNLWPTVFASNDTFSGSYAADRLFGYDGDDNMSGNGGGDYLYGGYGNDAVYGDAGNDRVYGDAGNDTVSGGYGNDVLNGGAGADNMRGSVGDDVYVVDNASDVVNESISGSSGIDTVQSLISFNLANAGRVSGAVEKLTLLGSGSINGTGNALNNVITGNAGANVLNGAAGNDTLNGAGGNDVIYGGAGKDTLTGGAGNDHFVFNTGLNASTNIDRITDFNVVQDTIRLENAVMPGLGSHVGTLYAASFWKSATGLAHDSNDRVIYETDTGWLNYDSNGSAAGGAVHIAQLNPNLALTNADFFVI